MIVAAVVVGLAKGYLLLGLVFASWFVLRGAGRLDPIAKQGSIGFRILLVPGATLLWPYLVGRVIRGGPAPREERNEHRIRARAKAAR